MQVIGNYQKQPPHSCQSIMRGGLLVVLTLFLNACSSSALPAYPPDIYEGSRLDGPAPDFQLVDQHGATLALSDFRGKIVVLTFFDSQCVDVCPLTAASLLRVNQLLENAAQSLVFLGVNVNVDADTLEDINAATQRWHLDEIASWHFLTGNPADLEAVWQAYGIAVEPPVDEGGDLSHSPGVFLIDRAGQQRWYVSTPFVGAGTPAPSLPLDELLLNHIQALLNEN